MLTKNAARQNRLRNTVLRVSLVSEKFGPANYKTDHMGLFFGQNVENNSSNNENYKNLKFEKQFTFVFKDAFAFFDTDNDGIVTTKLLGPLLRHCGENPSESEIQVVHLSSIK